MFQVYERDEDNEEILLHEAETPEAAKVFMQQLKYETTMMRRLFIKRVATSDDATDDSWRYRESHRFVSGEYKIVPWQCWPWAKPDHFCHVSTDDPSKIAYTASAQHGRDDRQTRMRPGKYLTMIGCPDVAYWAAKYAAENENLEIKFASTADEIEQVYLNGPDSCMSKTLRHYCSHIHPVRVYAAGDLEIAYLGDFDNVTARCVVWRAKKLYHRIYGDKGRLENLLRATGYECSYRYDHNGKSLRGARLLKIENEKGDGYVMPYLDGQQGLEDCGEYFKIGGDDYVACETDGTIDGQHSTCCNCGDRLHEDEAVYDGDGDGWCAVCWEENHFYCVNCQEIFHNDAGYTNFNDDTWCDNCASEHLTECEECGETCHNNDIYSGNDGVDYCGNCIAKHEDNEGIVPNPSPTIHDPLQIELPLTTVQKYDGSTAWWMI
jgi:hypothetical protein